MSSLTLRDGNLILDGTDGQNYIQFPDQSRMYSGNPRVRTFTSSNGVATINWDTCDVAKITLTEHTSIVFQNGGDMQSYLLEIKQASVGAFDAYLPASVKYSQDFVSYYAPATGKRDKLLFMRSVSEGTYDFITASKGF